MRKNRPSRRSRSNPFRRMFDAGKRSSLRRAPRRRDIEQLEARQVLSANVAGNDYFENQWNLNATGQQTEFDPTSPTRTQTLAEVDINVIDAWEQLATGSGVQVGIVSGGFDLAHEDLVGAFATDLLLDVLGGGGSFASTADTNGTAVAGIIGARNNDLGVVGIAYDAELVPIRAVADGIGTPTDAQTGATSAQAIRWRSGMVLDTSGDGILSPDEVASPENVIDVYFLSSGLLEDTDGVIDRDAENLDPEVLLAIEDGANAGRSTWTDADGDGLIDIEEISSLGSIYVVPAGDDNGTSFNFAFDDTGVRASSQYNELANSRYTIAVGAVDYDGRYENNATGTVTSFAEMGANVLIVAPSGTQEIDLAGDDDLNSGILTTDLTGNDGANSAPDPFFGETDGGDFFADVNYTSTFGGTEAAAAQVTAVVAQMLQVNPDLSRRDVEQILLMSAATNDQFDESWVINPYNYFVHASEGGYVAPIYQYHDLNTNDDPGTDLEGGVLPNGPFINFDGGFVNTNDFDETLIRSYFLNNPDLTIERFIYGFNESVAVNVSGRGPFIENDIEFDPVGGPFDPPLGPTLFGAIPDDAANQFTPGIRDLISPTNLDPVPLEFTNGVGYTISHGRGRYGEEYGYAHGLLDAELAVELAAAWLPDTSVSATDAGLFKPEEVSVSTPIIDANGVFLNVQPRADVATGRGDETFIIPGTINTGTINTGFYEQFLTPISGTEIDIDGTVVGEAITGGPFWNGDGSLSIPALNEGPSELLLPIDQSVDVDFLSLEWIELTAGVNAGDIDHLRVSILSPDGTQTELNPYRYPAEGPDVIATQTPQFGQGAAVPNEYETLRALSGYDALPPQTATPGDNVGTATGDYFTDNGFEVDINAGSDEKIVRGGSGTDYLAAGNAWTWTTNRHYGELFSVEASSTTSSPQDNVSLDDQWFLVLENYGNGAVELTGIQATFHGTEATGQRIQGKVGVDDNAQNIDFYNAPLQPGGTAAIDPTPEQLGDGIFNFDRYIEFGEVVVDPTPTFAPNTTSPNGLGSDFLLLDGDEQVVTVVLDDPTDSVDLSDLPGRTYRTIDPDTGIERLYPIVDSIDYFTENDVNLATQLADFDQNQFGGSFVTPSLRRTDGVLGYLQEAPRADLDASNVGGFATVRVDGTPGSLRNFDYSQESFGAGQTVLATQFRVDYDANGVPGVPVATGQVQRFVTGADGNYYFDVESNPAPPDPIADPESYNQWFNDFGATFEYEITVVDDQGRAWDRSYAPDFQEDPLSQVSYLGGATYLVQLFDATDVKNGETTVVEEVNFLLASATQLDVGGTVVRDVDGDGVQDLSDGVYENIRVYHDANDNNEFDAGETNVLTDANGAYQLIFNASSDADDTVSIRLDPSTYPEPLRPIAPLVLGQPELEINNFDAGDEIATGDFFLKPLTSFVSGTVWQDADADGVFDTTEVGVDGTAIGVDGVNPAIFVYHDVNEDGDFDAGTDTPAPVAADGTYSLEFQLPGTYQVRIDITNASVAQTFPFGGPQSVTLAEEDLVTDVNFGVRDLPAFDFGDLPESYGTLLDDDGARHRINNPDFYLGTVPPDGEFNGAPTFNADGDDNRNIDDEDGVRLLSDEIVAGSTVDFEIIANGGSPVLNAWVDWDGDGSFQADEQIFDDLGALGTGQPITITADVPADAADLSRYAARFRWGPFGLGPVGEANSGEVEDLWLQPDAVTVSGRVLRDADNDAIFENGVDTPVPGVTVFVDLDVDGVRDANEPSDVTDANGFYEFEALIDGNPPTIVVRIDDDTLPPANGFLNPPGGVFVTPFDPETSIELDYLLTILPRPEQAITGSVVEDGDEFAGLTGSETGLAGIQVQLLSNTDADPDLELIDSTFTNLNGQYQFAVPNTGEYFVRVVIPAESTLEQTTPSGSTTLTVLTGETVVAPTFGLFDGRNRFTRDYGDLRVGGGDNYPTTIEQGGASHLVVDGVFLGSSVDADSGFLQSSGANADDNDFSDDEDGVVLRTPQIAPGVVMTFDVTATGPAGSALNVWIDFDDNGAFDDDEHFIVDQEITSGDTVTTEKFLAPADTNTSAGFLSARFRWGTPGVGPTGTTGAGGVDAVGEVEDYRFPVISGPIPGDFDQNGLVEEADRDVWAEQFGQEGAGFSADANRDNLVDAADFTIWRDAFEAQAGSATAAASAPAVESVTLDVDAFAPMGALSESTTSAVDESLAAEEDVADADVDALGAALLEWSLGGPVAGEDADAVVDDLEEQDAEDDEEALALAEAFAV